MENKGTVSFLEIQTQIVVDFFEYDVNTITCFCFNPNNSNEEGYTENKISLLFFEKWLNDEGFLKGDYERTNPHTLDTFMDTWNFTLEEFMNTANHNWNINDLLTQFLNIK